MLRIWEGRRRISLQNKCIDLTLQIGHHRLRRCCWRCCFCFVAVVMTSLAIITRFLARSMNFREEVLLRRLRPPTTPLRSLDCHGRFGPIEFGTTFFWPICGVCVLFVCCFWACCVVRCVALWLKARTSNSEQEQAVQGQEVRAFLVVVGTKAILSGPRRFALVGTLAALGPEDSSAKMEIEGALKRTKAGKYPPPSGPQPRVGAPATDWGDWNKKFLRWGIPRVRKCVCCFFEKSEAGPLGGFQGGV